MTPNCCPGRCVPTPRVTTFGSNMVMGTKRLTISSCMRTKSSESVERKYGWDVAKLKRESRWTNDKQIVEIKVNDIRRPLQGSRSNDQDKVEALKLSIQEHGLLEPIDVLLVDGIYYGFSGCHRYQAHQEIGKKTILCRVRKATKQTLRFHMM